MGLEGKFFPASPPLLSREIYQFMVGEGKGWTGEEAKYSGYYSNVNLKAGIGRMAAGASPACFL